MDEPTAALGTQETAQVENIVRAFKDAGEPLVLISHNMCQVMYLMGRIVVFRRGLIVMMNVTAVPSQRSVRWSNPTLVSVMFLADRFIAKGR